MVDWLVVWLLDWLCGWLFVGLFSKIFRPTYFQAMLSIAQEVPTRSNA